MIQTKVYDQEYDVMWEDVGSHQRLIVFKDGQKIGHKDLGILCDTGRGVIEYCIKKILKDNEWNELKTKLENGANL